MNDLEIAEITYDSGEVRFRYARYLSSDASRWIRHGLFVAYHPNGDVASEGHYLDGAEHGEWRDYYPGGSIAAEGRYELGEEVAGTWRFWDPDGRLESSGGE